MRRLAVTPLPLGCLLVAFLPPLAAQFEVTVEPPVGSLDSEFLIRLTNHGAEPFPIPCCAAPVVTPAGEDGLRFDCSDCPAHCEPSGDGVLPAGGTLEHRWRPLASGCVWFSRRPGVFEVRWRGFPPGSAGRVELLPDLGRTLAVSADRPEARAGETVRLRLENTSSLTLTFDCCGGCCYQPTIVDPRGHSTTCDACPGDCFVPYELPPGKSVTFDWQAGSCSELRLPGRYRIIWGGFGSTGEALFGETEVLVLPPLDRRVDLSLSAATVRLGEAIRLTATNPLAVPVLREVDCGDEPIFIDELGRDSYFYTRGPCGPPRFEPIPPGGKVSIETPVPLPPFGELLSPGRWSVIWSMNFALSPADLFHDPVLGYAELTVLPREDPTFRRGDCDRSGALDLTDGVAVLEYLFLGRAAPRCLDACDGDDSGDLDVSDAIAVLGHLFLGGPPPPPPFERPGVDPTPDRLGCRG